MDNEMQLNATKENKQKINYCILYPQQKQNVFKIIDVGEGVACNNALMTSIL